jgi:hypothetical protein
MQIAASSSNAKSWRDVLPIHPAAEVCPMMSEPELKEWGEDIKKNGLKTSIAIFDSGVDTKGPRYWLLDGRNRLAAMEAVGLAPRLALKPFRRGGGSWWTLTLEGVGEDDHPDLCGFVLPQPKLVDDDPYAFVASANIHRRHLTAEGKRDAVAKLIKAAPEKSNRQIAEQAKVDHKTVGAVRDQLSATGEIPQLTKTVGKDGRARRAGTRGEPSPRALRRRQAAEEARGVRFKVMRRFANRQRVGKWQRRHSASGGYWQFLRRPLKFACSFASTIITVASSEGNLKEAAVIETSRIAKVRSASASLWIAP